MKKDVCRLNVNVPASLYEKLGQYSESLNINKTAALSVILSQFFMQQESLDTLKDVLALGPKKE